MGTISDNGASVEKDNKWGFVNAQGQEIVPCIYEKIENFKNDVARVKRNNKWGLVNSQGQEIIPCKYDPQSFFEMSRGLEKEPERGKRCYKCYKLRLEETARVASEMDIPFFCTTLTLSPYKNAVWLNEIGEDLNKEYKSTYLYSDFKKRNGYKRSIELSSKYNLYRQDYCGCIYSKRS